MSDFFKKAAGLIFNVQDDEEKTVSEAPANEKERTASPPPVNVSPVVQTVPAADHAATEKFNNYFKALYEKANLPGPDFYEFSNMTEAMGSIIPDDVKYPSVFAGFGGTLTKDKLLSSAGQYLDIIQRDAAEFEQLWQAAVKNKVEDRHAQMARKADEIRQMQEQIAKLNNEIVELNKLAQDEAARLASEKNAYRQQSALLQEKIKTGVEKINRFIR
jgi:hypothetical protein